MRWFLRLFDLEVYHKFFFLHLNFADRDIQGHVIRPLQKVQFKGGKK